MAAKKSKGWRSGKREVRPRMVQMTRHLVVTEGKETEPRYFEGVRAALGAANERKVAVIVKGTGKHTLDLLDFAVEHCRYAPETFDHVWLVYDKDDFPASDFDAMERKCTEFSDGSRTFHALWSNPCFELWPLLHFRYTTAPMSAASVSVPLLRRCLRTWASSTARTWTGCTERLTVGEAKHCSVPDASSCTIGGYATSNRLRKILQPG